MTYVGTAPHWPYRYTMVKENGTWTGEIEIVVDVNDAGLPFSEMGISSASDQQITFGAPDGVPGKALGCTWELTLQKSATPEEFSGSLIMTNTEDFKPVRLQFRLTPNTEMPSSRRPALMREYDDSHYRTDERLRIEVEVARKNWEAESRIATRMAELRSDDSLRGGVRREWIGPHWVHTQVSEEDSKFFERIVGVYLGGTTVSDENVRELSALTELRELFLHSTSVTDKALDSIGNLQSLQMLHLASTQITDQSLENIAQLKNLREIFLNETQVTEAGIARIRQRLPQTKVIP